MKPRVLLEGAGAGILIMLPYMWNQLSPGHLYIYHQLLPISSISGALLLDLVAACLVATLFFVLTDNNPILLRHIVWTATIGILSWRLTDDIWTISAGGVFTPMGLGARKYLILPFISGAYLLQWIVRDKYQQIINNARGCLAALGTCILWIFPQLFLLATTPQPKDAKLFLRSDLSVTNRDHRRIVWILFDELSYDQTFEHRKSDIYLPNFDRLSRNSLSFTHVQPVGYHTEQVIPSLFLGRIINKIRSSYQGDLVFTTDKGPWETFDAKATVFADAKKLGWNTGIVGWYNPYCRILAGVLDYCAWKPLEPPSNLSGNKSPIENALSLPSGIMHNLTGTSSTAVRSKIQDRDTERYLLENAIALIRDEEINFVFIHLSIPHPPGIFDRKTHLFKEASTYLDNLVLADDALGKLVHTLDTTSSASDTTLIVSSDHSWRVPIWKNGPDWTAEEEEASRGQFDPRPVLMVQFPEEEKSGIIASPISELALHGVIEGMLEGKIACSTDVENWLDLSK